MLVLEEEFFFCYRIDNVTNAMTMLFFAYKDMLSIAKGTWKLIGPCSRYKLLEKSLWYTTLYTSSCYKDLGRLCHPLIVMEWEKEGNVMRL